MAHIKVIMIGTRDNLQKIYDSVGDKDSSNALCEEIVRRFNEFPEQLKK
jgi:hypothetical protein